MKNKKVSIIVPVFNTERYLSYCIDSLLRQDYDNIEIVLVNDGSTDKSLVICKEFAEKYSNILLIDKENTGQSDSRYVGFMSSSGDYIYCVDSDDYLEPNAISVLVTNLESSNSDMSLARFRLVDESGKTLKVQKKYSVQLIDTKENIICDSLCISNIKVTLWVKLCKRSIWEKCYIEEIKGVKFNEDYLLTVLFSIASNRICFSNDIIYNALQRSGSTSRKIKPDMLLSHDEYFPIIKRSISDLFSNERIQNCFYLGYAKNIYYCLALIAYKSDNFLQFQEIYGNMKSESIFYSNVYRNCMNRFSFKYRLIDFFSRKPYLYYVLAKFYSLFYNH